jgi:tetratricopeptide (TPR) repeat protein
MTDPANPFADYSIDLMYDFISKHKLRRPIGSEYEYSNLAVGLLGNILADQTDKSYENLMLETIAAPLQMNETRITLSRKMKKNLATGHFESNPVKNWDLPALEGAGAIKSTVHDMLIFLAVHLQFFEHPLKRAMLLTHMPRHDKAGNNRVGLGWHILKGKEGDILWHNGGTGGYSAFAGFVKESGKGVVVLTNSTEPVDDIGLHLLDPSHPLPNVVPHIAIKLREFIDGKGINELTQHYDNLKSEFEDKYDFGEMGINSLGYYYLRRKQFAEAKAIFLLNIRENPTSSNVYDSYAEALMESGDKKEAIIYYKKSLDLNPGNLNAVKMLGQLGEKVQIDVPVVGENVLDTYTGSYQLAPGFIIVITREGNQLYAQATGQLNFPVFPKNETEFYYKVVDAQLVFNRNKSGEVESLTLFQNGMEIVGKKIK